MTVLFSTDFESNSDYQIPTGWQAGGGGTSPWLVRDVPSIATNGTKVLTSPGSSVGTPAEYVGQADRTTVEYEFRQKAAIDGTNQYIIGVAHTDHIIGNTTDFNYRFIFTATTSSVTADIAPFIGGSFPGVLGTGTRSMATSAGDVIGVKVRVENKIASVWVWNTSHESMPATPLATWTDSVQRAAGHFGCYWHNGGVVLLGLDQFTISDGATGSTNGTASGTPSSITLIAPAATGTGTGSATNGSGTGTPSALSLAATTATGSGTTAGSGTLTTPALKNNTGTLLASISGWAVNVYNATTGALVVRKTGLTTSAGGVLTVSDAAIVAGTTYSYEPEHATYGRRLPTSVAS